MAPTPKHMRLYGLTAADTLQLHNSQFSDFINKLLMFTAGITPMRTMALEFLRQGKSVVLLYVTRTQADAAFLQEFQGLAAADSPCFKFVFSASKDSAWTGRRGRVDKALIAEQVHLTKPCPSLFPCLCNSAMKY